MLPSAIEFDSLDVERGGRPVLKSVSLVGVAYGASARLDPDGTRRDFEQLFDWYEEGLLKPVIRQRFPLDQGADAMRVVWNRGALGKVVIEIA